MRFFVENPTTYCSVNNKGHEFNQWIRTFKHVLIADELSRDAFIESIRKKAVLLDAAYPRTKPLHVSVTDARNDDDYVQIRVYPDGQPDKQVFILSIYLVRGDFQFNECKSLQVKGGES